MYNMILRYNYINHFAIRLTNATIVVKKSLDILYLI